MLLAADEGAAPAVIAKTVMKESWNAGLKRSRGDHASNARAAAPSTLMPPDERQIDNPPGHRHHDNRAGHRWSAPTMSPYNQSKETQAHRRMEIETSRLTIKVASTLSSAMCEPEMTQMIGTACPKGFAGFS